MIMTTYWLDVLRPCYKT